MRAVCFTASQTELINIYTNSHTGKDYDWGFVLWKGAQESVRTQQALVPTLRAREGRRPPKEESEHHSLPPPLPPLSSKHFLNSSGGPSPG